MAREVLWTASEPRLPDCEPAPGGALFGGFNLGNGVRLRVGNLIAGCPWRTCYAGCRTSSCRA
jgi:hypothetical protein